MIDFALKVVSPTTFSFQLGSNTDLGEYFPEVLVGNLKKGYPFGALGAQSMLTGRMDC